MKVQNVTNVIIVTQFAQYKQYRLKDKQINLIMHLYNN